MVCFLMTRRPPRPTRTDTPSPSPTLFQSAGGGYVAHRRSEANRVLEALEETIDVARATGQRAEAYHLKAAGEKNWPKMAQAVAMVEAAHDEGLEISANMYAYTAGATGLTAALPPWVQAGGHDAMVARLKDPATREIGRAHV